MNTQKKGIACDCGCGSENESKPKKTRKTNLLNIVTGVLFFLFPKCPICWAAYASFFSFLGLENVSYRSEWKYVILGIFILGSAVLLWKHYKNKSWINITIYTLGIVLLMTTYYLNLSQTWWVYTIAALMLLSNLKFPKRESRFGVRTF
ncbi:hypothetical protein POV27_15860 [Aureisphaera galaxeae]|uniref:hypothetical protein n=1 Tax=Aureisphaera galaxeae TaxID=1538023 RepID=UPI0023503BCE|nr:hypothetical protein [Aureisphaera galaxeae]MDC8005534.1 hypothetical protein [Aureisphaera galaxeae]